MKVAALISGGKDSALALYKVLNQGFKVAKIVTLIPKREDSWMFHYPNAHLTSLFAEAAGLPLVSKATSGKKSEELEDLKSVLSRLEVEGLVYGVIASSYQKRCIEEICRELNLKPIAPLWGVDPQKILDSLLDLKFKIVITGVYAYGFDESWLGREMDANTIKDLIELNRRLGISLVGEGGEYETLVLDAPFFKKRIKILNYEKIWNGDSGYLKVLDATLQEKT
ncbi:TIGR00289 family protein [Candidatus Bathyarchaeota archaeon]|nr:TIGR00289 family protein [Candidatus Bathyarchaeota archaeon]